MLLWQWRREGAGVAGRSVFKWLDPCQNNTSLLQRFITKHSCYYDFSIVLLTVLFVISLNLFKKEFFELTTNRSVEVFEFEGQNYFFTLQKRAI